MEKDTNVPKSITQKNGKIFLSIHAKPGSKKEGITNIDDEEIEIAVKAQAQNNKANFALIDFLVDALEVSKNAITFESGGTSRNKVISVNKEGLTVEEVYNKLKENLL